MRINLMNPVRDAQTHELVQHIELRFSAEEWDAFANEMQRAFSDDGQPDRKAVLTVLRKVFERGLSSDESLRRTLVVPVDRVSGAEFRSLMSRASYGKKR